MPISLLLALGLVQDAPAATVAPAATTKRLSPTMTLDTESRLLRLDGRVVFREGALELALCPVGTKEHESLVAAVVEPRQFQVGLLLAGAVPGGPAQVDPFRPPFGQRVKVWAKYEQDGQVRTVDVRQWIHRVAEDGRTQPMVADFVFAGSGWRRAPGSPRPVWLGDDGDLVCVVNFAGSVIDVDTRSADFDPRDPQGERYEAKTAAMPPLGTPVELVFEPLVE